MQPLSNIGPYKQDRTPFNLLDSQDRDSTWASMRIYAGCDGGIVVDESGEVKMVNASPFPPAPSPIKPISDGGAAHAACKSLTDVTSCVAVKLSVGSPSR